MLQLSATLGVPWEKKEGKILLDWKVCLFLEAILTNDHKLDGLKQ